MIGLAYRLSVVKVITTGFLGGVTGISEVMTFLLICLIYLVSKLNKN
jgi:hypothetical protein